MNERQKRLGEFVVSRGDAPEMLETGEEAFDQISIAIEMPVEGARRKPIGSGRNHRFGASRFDPGHEVIGVVPLVGHDRLTGQILDQCRGVVDIGDLSGRENHPQRIAQRVDGYMQFGQPAARTADLLTPRFFWAPAEC